MYTRLRVPRIEDLPYNTSPPVEFVYQSSAAFAGGVYTWADNPTLITPNRPLIENCLYYFRTITLSADIDEADFTSVINTNIRFQMYRKSDKKAIMFREPIYMVKFLENFIYRLVWITRYQDDRLYASFNGVLNQNANLVGKSPITLIAIISAQEIVDDGFIKTFEQKYPDLTSRED